MENGTRTGRQEKKLPQLEQDLRDLRTGLVEACTIFKSLEGIDAKIPRNISVSKEAFFLQYIVTVVQDCDLTNTDQDIILAAFGFLQGYESLSVQERHLEYCKWVGICKNGKEQPLDIYWGQNIHRQMNSRENSSIKRLYVKLTVKMQNNQGVLGYITGSDKIQKICENSFPRPHYVQEDGYRKCSVDGRIFYIPFTAAELRTSVNKAKRNLASLEKIRNDSVAPIATSDTHVNSEISQSPVSPAPLSFRWGDNGGGRPSYTLAQIRGGILGDTIVFNSISDSVIGNEKNFVGVREDNGIHAGKENRWHSNHITVENGKTYIIRLYVHNNNPNGIRAIAKNVRVAINLPYLSGKQIRVTGFIECANATPSEYWANVVFYSDTAFHLEYVYGSVLLENNGLGRSRGIKASDDIVTKASSGGILVDYDSLDGSIPGCYKYDGFITIRVRAIFDNN